MRAACAPFARVAGEAHGDENGKGTAAGRHADDPEKEEGRLLQAMGAAPPGREKAEDALLAAMAAAAGVFYNASRREACLEFPDDPNFDGIWDYQFCMERLPQETYFPLQVVF